jgi:uncharacterized protein
MAIDAFDAWNRGDFEAMIENAATDVVWHTAGVFPDFDPVYRGHDGVRRFWENLREAWEIISIDPGSFVEHGNKLMVELHFDAKGRESGVEVEMDLIQVLTYRENQIVGVTGYLTPEEARAAEGIPERHD